MNVYDFDNTIYRGDSSIDFYKFCLKRNVALIRFLPKQVIFAGMYALKLVEKKRFKEVYFSFLKGIKDINYEIKCFWDINEEKIKEWYKKQQRDDDVIISASPDFLIDEIGKRLGVNNIIATKVDEKSGIFNSENCYGEEKVKRFFEKFPSQEINSFFSDSLSDKPLAQFAEKSFLVRNEDIKPWENI